MDDVDFFQVHDHWPWLLLFGLAFFPRITTLFVGGPFGILAWLGWLFCPHFLVAFIATTYYWHTNPVLCVIAWFFAFVGTGSEGRLAHHGTRWRRRRDERRRREADAIAV